MAKKSTVRAADDLPPLDDAPVDEADWHRRVVGRSLRSAAERSVDRGNALIGAAATVLERSDGGDITVQQVADEAGQSLRTLYQYFESKDDLLLALFEESMRYYAAAIRSSIDDLDEPLERLAGALIAAGSMPSVTRSALDKGMARLRHRLAESRPDLIGRAQQALNGLFAELVDAAADAGQISAVDGDEATFLLLSLNTACLTSDLLGNDAGVSRPELNRVVTFCLLGLGAEVDEARVGEVSKRVGVPSAVEWFPGERRVPAKNGTKRRASKAS